MKYLKQCSIKFDLQTNSNWFAYECQHIDDKPMTRQSKIYRMMTQMRSVLKLPSLKLLAISVDNIKLKVLKQIERD